MENKKILSICIPTYNRSEYLERTLLSIVNQKRFQETSDVEIVVSDNCSSDNTGDVVQKFIGLYHEKIRYYRNPENIEDLNFGRVLSYGDGVYLKLNNDTLVHHPDSLDHILDVINDARKPVEISGTRGTGRKAIIFFSNGTLKSFSIRSCDCLDSFVKVASFHSTWIGGFGVWKDEYDSIDNFTEMAKLKLISAVLFRQISFNRRVLVDNRKLFDPIPPPSRGGYNIYQIFVANYIGLLEKYSDINKISPRTIFIEKGKLLIKFLVPWFINIRKDRKRYHFDQKRGFSIIVARYWAHPALYFGIFYLAFRLVQYSFREMCGAFFIKTNATL